MLALVTPLAAAIVDWGGLVQVVLFAVVAGLVIVGAFSLGVVGLDRWRAFRSGAAPTAGQAAESAAAGSISDAASPVGVSPPMFAFGSLAMAIAGFGICVVAVLLGLWSIVHR